MHAGLFSSLSRSDEFELGALPANRENRQRNAYAHPSTGSELNTSEGWPVERERGEGDDASLLSSHSPTDSPNPSSESGGERRRRRSGSFAPFGGVLNWVRRQRDDNRGAYSLVGEANTRNSRGASLKNNIVQPLLSCLGLGSFPAHTTHQPPPSRYQRASMILVMLMTGGLLLLGAAIAAHGGFPRTYYDMLEYEHDLKQHRWDLPPQMARRIDTDGEGFLRFPNHLFGLGLNNVLQETFVTAHIAHLSNRSYVFEDYVWSRLPAPFVVENFAFRPTRIPMTAFVNGFIGGSNVSAPIVEERAEEPEPHLSISTEYWNYICGPKTPAYHRVVLDASAAPTSFQHADALLSWWADYIKIAGAGKRCVEVRERPIGQGRRVVDWNFFSAPIHIRSLTPRLLGSPVLKYFDWSTLVSRGRYRRLLKTGLIKVTKSSADGSAVVPPRPQKGEVIPGLLAVHIRRGDYLQHCTRLAGWRSGFMGFSLAAEVPQRDVFDLSKLASGNATGEWHQAVDRYYKRRCLPEIDQIVQRARSVREDWAADLRNGSTGATFGKPYVSPASPTYTPSPLKRIMLLSNGDDEWLYALSLALQKDGWEIVNPNAVDLTMEYGLDPMDEVTMWWEERDVGGAVDMALAETAEVFLGNGFSTLSGNVIVLRLASGIQGLANRLL